ncbi:hypothetical protein Patl1_09883 [Pistacia atlantica]|uniref:Uncharacterized protein n=1 Tax=Pistacia atlantica TaxID=434234 RepID=A0ACC1A606_9ROSI|nr:hypothetical protein Patl1_09883 [Pistacia atlantica]
MTEFDYWAKNIYGNTTLHEAAADGNIEAVKLLVEHDKELLEDRNKEGETPLFKVASYGQTKVVLALYSDKKALVLLELDYSLATLEDGNGMTSLQLLATMPSAFKSRYRVSIQTRLLYFCTSFDTKNRVANTEKNLER